MNVDVKVTDMQKEVDELKTYTVEKRPFKEVEEIIPLDKFAETHEFTFPLKTLDEFITFDEKLVNDVFKDLVSYSKCKIGSLRIFSFI